MLTQRKGYRQDDRLGRVRGSYVNGVLIDTRDAGLALMEDSGDLCAGLKPGEVVRANGAVVKLKNDDWRWGNEQRFGGGGTVRVGPGWGGDTPRFDSGEVELVINGSRCVEVDGAWRTADGAPCPLVEEGR